MKLAQPRPGDGNGGYLEGPNGTGLKALLCLSVLGVLHISMASGQNNVWGRHEFQVRSCDLADSLLGPMAGKGKVLVWHLLGSDSFELFMQKSYRLMAKLERSGRAPQTYPAPVFTFGIDGDFGRQLLAARPKRPVIDVILDDTLRLSLGTGDVGNYTGPVRRTVAPVGLRVSPMAAVQIARAKAMSVSIDSVVRRIDPSEIRYVELLYRFATCDSLPGG